MKHTFYSYISLILFLTFQFTAAQQNFYWVGGTGTWTDLNKWKILNDEDQLVNANAIPTFTDNIFFTSHAGTGIIYITIPNSDGIVSCNNLTIDESVHTNITIQKQVGSINHDASVTLNVYGTM